MSRRHSITERARQESEDDQHGGRPDATLEASAQASEPGTASSSEEAEQALFDDELLNAKLARRAARKSIADKGPASRPSRRRESSEEDSPGEDRFPWNFQFDDDDEPEELQASTPLLSRAFRATTG